MLPPTSHIRVQVEDTRTDLLKWLKKKWVGVQQEGGFNDLEGWAVKEISGGKLQRHFNSVRMLTKFM